MRLLERHGGAWPGWPALGPRAPAGAVAGRSKVIERWVSVMGSLRHVVHAL